VAGFMRPRRRRREYEPNAPRPLGCFWPLFWLILLIVLLGLLFGGYRKGTKISAPEVRTPLSYSSSATAESGHVSMG
jgi:hypothetical protein